MKALKVQFLEDCALIGSKPYIRKGSVMSLFESDVLRKLVKAGKAKILNGGLAKEITKVVEKPIKAEEPKQEIKEEKKAPPRRRAKKSKES